MSPSMQSIELDLRDRVAVVSLARPAAGNAIDDGFCRDLLSVAFAIDAAPQVRAVVLTARGDNFCFGGDLNAMHAAGVDARSYVGELASHLHAALAVLARLDAPVIAAVNGMAAGGGLGLVLAADLAIAARGARFMAAYTAVGLSPDGSTSFLLPRAVGYKRAMELLLTNRVLDAQEALEWGLVNRVVEDSELDAAAMALAGQLAAGPTGAFGAVKRLLAESEPGLEAQLGREARSIAARAASAEGREGIAAFLAKRAPRY